MKVFQFFPLGIVIVKSMNLDSLNTGHVNAYVYISQQGKACIIICEQIIYNRSESYYMLF